MDTEVIMPQMGESLTEGTVSRWLKKTGDRVEKDEILFEITTDKIDTEVPAPVAGTLEKILVPQGETVAVGTTVATITHVGKPVEPKPAPEAPSTGGGHFQSAHEPITFERKARRPSDKKHVQRRLSTRRTAGGKTLPNGVTSFVEVDMNRIVRYLDKDTTYLPFVAEAAVKALKRFPLLNIGSKAVHLGIATPTDEGLTVPVVKNADEMNSAGLARAIHDRIERAHTEQVSEEDLR